MPALPNRHPTARRAAFTLLEMTVVLAIIGLIAGSVLEGRAILHKSELQTIINDFSKYSNAYNQFVTQFGAKPGDFNNTTSKATDVWGTAGGTGFATDATCTGALAIGNTATCNGDGNDAIAGPYVTGVLTNAPEIFTAWQQLANAKLIDGQYSGVGATASPGVNVPAGRLTNSGYMLLSQAVISDATSATNSPNYFYGNYGAVKAAYGTFIIVGAAPTPGNTGLSDNELLSPKDAYLIDSKSDDGDPALGQIVTYFSYPSGNANTCVVHPGGALAAADGIVTTTPDQYNVAVGGQLCNLIDIIIPN